MSRIIDGTDWTDRLDRFEGVLALLERTIFLAERRKLSALEQAGLVQRFELALDLGWQTLRDYLADIGTPVAVPVPIEVLRAAFWAGLIEDGDGWIAAMRTRNTSLDRRDADGLASRVEAIRARYAPLLRALIARLASIAPSDEPVTDEDHRQPED